MADKAAVEKHREYWKNRALQAEKRTKEKTDQLLEEVKAYYQKAAEAIEKEIAVFYTRYSAEQGISYAEAAKALNSREAKEWRKTLEEYTAEINALPAGELKDQLQAELDARAYRSRIDRLGALKSKIELETNRLFYKTEAAAKESLGEAFTDEYYHKMFHIQQQAGVMFDFAHPDAELVEQVLSYPWSGANFSSRLWKNKEALVFNLKEILTQSMIRGQGAVLAAKELAAKMERSFAAADRLIRTESSYLHNRADIGTYEAAGVEQYEFMATNQHRTCGDCGELDGQVFLVKEARTGVNYPPLHPHCRCCTVERDSHEWEDWAAAGKPMPKRMTYKEWAEEQGIISAKENAAEKNHNQFKMMSIFPEEKAIVNSKIEKAVLLDIDGTVILRKTGTEKQVRFTREEFKLFENKIFSHSHPQDFPPSDTDIFRMYQYKIKEVRAVTETGVYSVGYKGKWEQEFKTAQEFRTFYFSVGEQEINKAMQKVEKGEWTAYQADRHCQIYIVQKLAERLGFSYEFTPWEE